MKTWLPWAIAIAALALLSLERWATTQASAEIQAREHDLAAVEALLRERRPVYELRRDTVVRWLGDWEGIRAAALAETLPGRPRYLPLLRSLVTIGDGLAGSCSAFVTTCDSLVATERRRGDLYATDAADWKRLARGRWLRPSAALLVSPLPAAALEGQVELGRTMPIVIRGTIEADTAGVRRRLWVGIQRSF